MMDETVDDRRARSAASRRSRSSGGCRGAERVGEHKTSTLMDLEAGKPLELGAIVDAPSSSWPTSPARLRRT